LECSSIPIGVPVAWMLSFNGKYATIQYFLQIIKAQSPNILLNIYMMDHNQAQVKVIRVTYPSCQVLYSWWHVLRAIQTHFDMILTPFSVSTMTDTAVDSLPELFLAYCTFADSNDLMSDDDRVVPQGSDSDPAPLLTSCALGLGPSFLSRSRRWSTYQWRIVLRRSASVTYLSLSPYAMIHLL
jgi:hypothetical protein